MANYNPRCGLIWRVGDTECIEVEVFEQDGETPVADLSNYGIQFKLYNADGSAVFTKETVDFTHEANIFSCTLADTDLDPVTVTGIYEFQVRVTDPDQSRSQSTAGRVSVQVMLI